MVNRYVFGNDQGASSNKLMGSHGGIQLSALVSAETGQVVTHLLGFRSQKPPLRIRWGGLSLYVGEGAHDWGRAIENLDYDRMTGVPETRAVFYASLTQYMLKYGEIDAPIYLAVGLPLEPLSGAQAGENADAVRSWLLGEHCWEADGQSYRVEVADAKVTSQPSGALFDFLLDEQGHFIPERKELFKKELGIISVGFNTIELLTIRDRTPVQGMTAGRSLGVRRLLELANRDGLYTLGELNTLLRSGHLDVRETLPLWMREVTGQIEKVWGQRYKRFERVILVGGGILLLGDLLTDRFDGKVFIPDDPVMSISRGLYKQAINLVNRQK